MCKYERVITRTPCKNFADGLTHGRLGRADVELACRQHAAYVEALRQCGHEVTVLNPIDTHPDSCFVEDSAIVTDRVAILTSFRFSLRQGEENFIHPTLEKIYGSRIEKLGSAGSIEGGDICRIGTHFLIGLSRRTSDEGAQQLADLLARYGFTSEFVNLRSAAPILHLTTGMSYIGKNTVIVTPEFASYPAFEKYHVIITPPDESYASNTVRMNEYVIMAEGFPKTIRAVRETGFNVMTVPMSEFEKQDGGLSCLSLRLPKLSF